MLPCGHMRNSHSLASIGVCVAMVSCGGSGLPPHPAPVHFASPELLVTEYYRRVNAEDLGGVMALLITEPTLSEPFSHPGAITVHRGYQSVASFFDYGFRTRDDQVITEYVRPTGSQVQVGWSLHSTEGDGVSGTTQFGIRSGQIAQVDIQQRD